MPDQGRLAGLFCALHRERFSGLLHARCGEHYATIGFRDGRPVTFADPAQAHTLGEEMVARGQLTRAQYTHVLARMTDVLVDDETQAFCEQAVALGFLSEHEASYELSERIRARLIQVLAWNACEVDLDSDPEALNGRGEHPQDVGAIVYMGVRTFYDDNYLAECFPELDSTYLRLSAAPASVAHFFGFDDDEFRFLRRIDPEAPLTHVLVNTQLDQGHALGILMLVRLGEFGEFANTPFTQLPDPERSGARPNPMGARSAPPRAPSTQGFPAARPRPSSSPGFQANARPSSSPGFRPPSTQNMPAASSPGYRAPSKQNMPAAGTRPPQQPVIDATQEALLEAAARAARSRKASSTSIRRVSHEVPATPPPMAATPREPQTPARPMSGPVSPANPAARPNTPPSPEYTKAHLAELLKRHKHGQPADASGGKRDPARELRHARDLLREQQNARAEELLRGLVEQEPQNEVLRTYHLFSCLRAHPELDDSHVSELIDLAKKLIQDPEHSAFATYMLGHLYLHAKKDDLAEKYFRRAHAADRSNRDAERHVLILERRKQVAAEAEANANRKIFGITINKPKS
jgi:tetratricopeptide (TPR) repeat protein